MGIASKHEKPSNIHREPLPTFVPRHIQDNVELCYLRLEQHGWFPLANVDPAGTYGDGKKEHPSYKLWYEYANDFNEEGVKKFKNSPRLYNYNKREKQAMNPQRPDSTRALGEFRHWEKKVEKPLQDKVTNVDGAVGREGWRAHVTLGNGVVRWTDDVFDWQQSNMLNPTGVNENGKSMYIYPNELEPMYSSFSPDKIYRWRPPEKKKKEKKKAKKKMTREEIVQINEIRRQNMETRGSINGCKPSPRKPSTVTMLGNQEKDILLNSLAAKTGLRMQRVLPKGSPMGIGGGLRRASPSTVPSTLTSRSNTTPPKIRFFDTAPAGENIESVYDNRNATPKTDNRQVSTTTAEKLKAAEPDKTASADALVAPAVPIPSAPSPDIPKIIPATIHRGEDDDTVVSNITGVGGEVKGSLMIRKG